MVWPTASASVEALFFAFCIASMRTCSLYCSIFECDTFRIETFEMPSPSRACHTLFTSADEPSCSWYLAVATEAFFLKNSLERLATLSCFSTSTPARFSAAIMSRCWLSTEILPFESRSLMTIWR